MTSAQTMVLFPALNMPKVCGRTYVDSGLSLCVLDMKSTYPLSISPRTS